MKGRLGLGAFLACSLVLVACGGGSSSSSTSTGGGGGAGGVTVTGAKVIDVNSMKNPKKGTITYCTGKDTTGAARDVIKRFNAKYESSKGVSAKLVEFSASADQQRTAFIQRQQAKSSDCDVFSSDVIWTAEFAGQKWLYDLTPYMEKKKSELIPATAESTNYANKYWGVPQTSDAAFIYYQQGKSPSPPSTWQQLYQDAKSKGGFVYQGAAYEGLTCDFLEVAYAAGGTVISDDGKSATINSPENVKALTLMVDGIKNGSAPKAVTTYMEPETDQAWQTGRYAFMRNWTYSYALNNRKQFTKIAGKFKVAPLPSFEGAGKASVLGGHNSVISAYTKNPGASLLFADFFVSPEVQTAQIKDFSLAAALTKVYDDPAVKNAVPYAAELKQALLQAKTRPVSPVYPQISQAIYKNVNDALAGRTSPQDALKKAQSQIDSALATF
ncbi:MAG TPA: ABC transporter substrate-binding protein [Vicinamibacteria bacterium]|nr:ABC transporter substrate-binding protein [Vicinamibacteria bacterium]